MCKKELLTRMKTKGSLVIIEQCVEEIVKEKYRGILVEDEIFDLFEKMSELTKDLFEEDKVSQEFDITYMLNILLSMSKKLGMNEQDTFEKIRNIRRIS